MESIITSSLKRIDHIVLTTAKIDACLAFYQKIGFQSKHAGERYELYAGSFKINVHLQNHELNPHAHKPLPGTLDLCFETTHELSDLRKQMMAMGMSPTKIANKQGALGSMQSFYVRDPDQNLLEFAYYE